MYSGARPKKEQGEHENRPGDDPPVDADARARRRLQPDGVADGSKAEPAGDWCRERIPVRPPPNDSGLEPTRRMIVF